MRLTEKASAPYVEGTYQAKGRSLLTKTYQQEMLNKLGQYEDIDDNPKHLAKIKKALEIIKEKDVDITSFRCSSSLENYNLKENGFIPLTQEEYDLLKEVLL